MKDTHRTKKQLVAELAALRQRITDLETADTERKRVEEALRESEERLRDIIENAQSGYFFVDANGYYRHVNKAWLVMHGYNSAEEVIGQPFSITQVESDVEQARVLGEQVLGGEPIQAGEFTRRCKDGSVGFHTYASRPVAKGGQVIGLEGFMIDITERKRAEEALRESEARYRSLFENSVMGISQALPDGRLISANTAYAQMYGYANPEEIMANVSHVGQQLYANPEDREEVLRILKEKGVMEPREMAVVRRDGTRLFVLVGAREVRDSKGNLRCYQAEHVDITERKRAEEALRRQQEVFQRIVDNIPVMIAYLDQEGQHKWVNQCWQSTLGWSLEEAQRTNMLTEIYPDLEYQKYVVGYIADSAGTWADFKTRARDGRVLDTSWANVLLSDGSSIGIGLDITERKRAEEALQQRTRALALLNQASQAFSSTLDQDVVFSAVLEEARTLFDATASSIWTLDPQTQELVCRQATGSGRDAVLSWRLPPEVGLAGWVANHGESLIVADALADERHFGAIDQQSGVTLRSILSVPLRAKQAVIGVLQVLDTEAGRFSQADLQVLEPLAASAAIAIENARLYQQAQREIEERKRAEDALRVALTKYETLFDSFPLGITVSDGAGKILETNPMAERLVGVPQEEHVQRRIDGQEWRIVRPDGTRMPAEEYASVRALKENRLVENVEMGIAKAHGEITWVSVTAAPLPLEGYGVVVTYGDITERKRAEDELARSNRLISALSEVGARVQTSLVPDWIMETLGAELEQLGWTYAVTLMTPDGNSAVVRYMSFESRLLESAEKLMGATMQGYHLSHDHFPYFTQVIEQKRGVFVPDLLVIVTDLLHFTPKPLVEQAARLNGITHETAGVFLPLVVEGQAIGTLAVLGKDLKEADLTALSVFASQVAVAMQNARLFEDVRAGRVELQNLSRRLVEVQETERRFIARELHDEVGQVLTGLKMLLETSSRLPADTLRSRLSNAQSLVEQLMEQVQGMSLDLRPTMLDDLGLLPALLWLTKRFADQTGVRVHLEHSRLDRRFAPEIETAVYRITQEALTNVARHAGMEEATVRLWATLDTLDVQVEDRGKGFDVESALAASTSIGLSGMRERAIALGGNLMIESTPGAGTRVNLQVPLSGSLERRVKER